MEILFIVIALCAVLAAVVYGLRTRYIMKGLDRMVEEAIQGDFRESSYDESRLSRLEAKLSRFLGASGFSHQSIETDRQNLTATIGDISHQTKTPIANILLYTQLLQEQKLSPESRELAAQIASQSEKLDFLIQSLVKTSRLETGVVRPVPEVREVASLMAAVERAYASKAADKGITLTVPGDVAMTASFDPKWTAEALGNLVDNAIKYTPNGGSVTLSCQKYELFCRLDVTDTGLGIPEEEQASIFQRFYRGRSVQQEEGVGIGLYLARQIIAAQGGYIKVVSAPAQGSTFSVFLPAGE